MIKKITALILALLSVLTLAACEESSTNIAYDKDVPSQEDQSDSTNESVRISINDFDIAVDVVDDKPVFWVTNNSEYTVTGPKLKLINMKTNEVIIAYEWRSTLKPGETSTVVTFFKDGDVDATVAEVQAATWSTFEANYENSDGSRRSWFEYNYITNTIRGFDY